MKSLSLKLIIVRTVALLGLVFFAQHSTAQIIIPLGTNVSPYDKEWLVNSILDSVINKVAWNKGGIICVTDKYVSIDTITLNKVKRTESDSVILGKFLKKNQKKISSKEFWGVTTGFGERSRFYEGKMYLVWETPSPYVYKIDYLWKGNYYFSETLMSPLVLLNRQKIDSAYADSTTRGILKRSLLNSQQNEALRREERKDAVIEASVDVLNVLFQVMLIALDSGMDSHSHSKPDHSEKRQTGRRK